MERVIGFLLAIAVTSIIVGCTSTWETEQPPQAKTYVVPKDRLSRNAGLLHRLLVLPPAFKSTDCPELPSDRELADQLYSETLSFLADWKGYQAVVLEGEATLLMENEIEHLGIWQEGATGDGVVQEPQRSKLRVLADAVGVDGIVLIHGHLRCFNTADIVMYFMIIGMPNFGSKLFGENLSAGIYDGDSGRLVWMHHINVMHPLVGGGSAPILWTEQLFGILENAVPEILMQ